MTKSLPEDSTPRSVTEHSERWRDVVTGILGLVAVVALTVLYVLLR